MTRFPAIVVLTVGFAFAGDVPYPVVGTGQSKCYDDRGEISSPQPGQPSDRKLLFGEWGRNQGDLTSEPDSCLRDTPLLGKSQRRVGMRTSRVIVQGTSGSCSRKKRTFHASNFTPRHTPSLPVISSRKRPAHCRNLGRDRLPDPPSLVSSLGISPLKQNS